MRRIRRLGRTDRTCVFAAALVACAVSFARAQGSSVASLVPSASASSALENRGFAVTPGGAAGFPEAYADIAARGLPSFVTVDSALSATDALVDAIILSVEEGELCDRLTELSRELVRLSEQQYILASDSSVRESARRNLAFFAVGLSLLDPDYFPPEFVLALVERELSLIEEGRAVAISPIMGPTPLDGVLGPGEDYTAYVPRGPYADGLRLARFHRAAAWYGRMAFALPEGRVADYGLTRQALLAVLALKSEAGEHFELWERIYDPMVFHLGSSGDPTVREYTEIAEAVFGEGFDLDDLANQELLALFASRVAEIAPAHFETHELRGMRLLARPYFPDTGMFARLVSTNDARPATAVDLAALLGSLSAREVLNRDDAFASDVYRAGFSEIELEIKAMTYGDWTRDVTTSWLYALSSLVRRPASGAPAFMTSPEWDAKALSTVAAAWSVERTRSAGGAAVPDLRGGEGPSHVVEPYPETYARLRELLEHLRDRLWEHYLLTPDIEAALGKGRALLTFLEQASRAELGDGAPGAARSLGALALAAAVAEATADLIAASGAGAGESGFARGDRAAGRPVQALGLSAGPPDLIWVDVGGRGDGTVAVGAVYSLFESVEKEGSIEAGSPARPGWVAAFLSR